MAIVAIVVQFFWGSREAKRAKELRRHEAEKIANLTPELQQLNIYASGDDPFPVMTPAK